MVAWWGKCKRLGGEEDDDATCSLARTSIHRVHVGRMLATTKLTAKTMPYIMAIYEFLSLSLSGKSSKCICEFSA